MGIFGGEKKADNPGAVDSIIGEKAKFMGEIISSGAVSVNGEFEGKLFSKGEIIIARGSRVKGDIKGKSVVVSGKVDGNIIAEQGLEISKSGKVHGDLTGGRVIIEEGASYRGRVKIEGTAVEGEGAEDEETGIIAENEAVAVK